MMAIANGTKNYGTYRLACGDCWKAWVVKLENIEDAKVCPKCGSTWITVS